MNFPPWRRAYSQLKRAVRTPPMVSLPVGLGAKRVTTFGMKGPRFGGSGEGEPRVADHLVEIPADVAGSRVSYQTGRGRAKTAGCEEDHRGRQHPAHRDPLGPNGAVEPLGVEGQHPVSYTHLRAHETRHDLVCRL